MSEPCQMPFGVEHRFDFFKSHLLQEELLTIIQNIGYNPQGIMNIRDTHPWKVFLQACKDIGYDVYFSDEQCAPILTNGHKPGGIDTVDQRCTDARNFFQQQLRIPDINTVNKPEKI